MYNTSIHNTYIPTTYMSIMVEIQYSPIRKIVIHEVIKSNLEEFTANKAQPPHPQMQMPPLRWIDGIVFEFAGMVPTPELVNEQSRDGVIHWSIVEWAEMPQFQNNLMHPTSGVSRRIIDGSANTAVSDVIKWLKNQPQWKSTAVA